jgi:hypothetical protein
MTGVSFIKRGKDEVESDEIVLFVDGAGLSFAELMLAIRDVRPAGYEFYTSWNCGTAEDGF